MFKEDCTFMTNAFWLVLYVYVALFKALFLRICTLPLRSTIYKKEIRNYQTLRGFNKTKNAESAIS